MTKDNLGEAKDRVTEGATEAKDRVVAGATEAKDRVAEAATKAKDSLADTVGVVPAQPPIKSQSDVNELKSRLEWGEPAFTILDVRNRTEYNNSHIMGAMSMPIDELVDRAKASIDTSRDIYVYGEGDAETATSAQQLRSAGFVHVAELIGGLPAWKAVAGPTEGILDSQAIPGGEAYNVVSQLQHQAETQNKPKTK